MEGSTNVVLDAAGVLDLRVVPWRWLYKMAQDRTWDTLDKGMLFIYIHYIQGVPKKKKDILNIHIKAERINIFLQKICWTESTIFVVKCQKFTFLVQLFIT